MRCHRSALLVAASLVATGAATPDGPSLPRPPDAYLTGSVHLSAADRRTLLSGKPVTKLLESDASKEVGVFGAVWIPGAPHEYVALVRDIERFEQGDAFRVTKRISNPPELDDFAALEIPDEDLADLKDCRVGRCEFKLGADALDLLRSQVKWNQPSTKADVTAIVRRLALEYVTGYLDGGNEKLAVYRDKDRPTFVANEFRSMIEDLPPLDQHLPDMKRYLLEYPRVTLPDSTDFLYWQETQFGLKSTIRISHVVIQERPEQTVVASKMLYASHYFWTALELRVLVPDPGRGRGFWFVTVSRSRSDGLSGFTGRVLRGRVQSEAVNGTLSALAATKAKLEASRR